MARRGNAAIARRKAETAAKLAQLDANATEDARITRTKKQLAWLDDLIDDALAKNKPALFLKLTSAKNQLWNLVSPRVAPKKPSRDDRRQRLLPVPMDVGNWTPAPVVVPPPPVQVSTPLAQPAPVNPVPVPAALESLPPPPPVAEASPQPEAQPPVPGSVSPPTSVRVPPMVFELKNALSLLFKRPAGVWTDTETRLLLTVAQRRNATTELQLIVNYRRRLSPPKSHSFSPTALALLENWDRVFADARRHLPR